MSVNATPPPMISPPRSRSALFDFGRGSATEVAPSAQGRSAWLNPHRHASTWRGTRRWHDGQVQADVEGRVHCVVSGSRPSNFR